MPNHGSPKLKPMLGKATKNPVMALTDKQQIFVKQIMKGVPQGQAARLAGYKFADQDASVMLRKPHIQDALAYLGKRHEKAADMSRKKVMDGFKEAIEMAKLQGDPSVMVNGWREIGRMCGYYAAEKKILDVNITAKRAVDKLETLSDAELLEMIEEDGNVIEGEAVEVLDDIQTAEDVAFEEAGYDS